VRRPLALTVVVLAFLLLTVAATSSAAHGTKAFRVASTLDGKTVLPRHIRWHALPTLPARKIRKVDFLIDGKLRWVEHGAPYSYSDDSGYLVTSWLTPGRHAFIVRAVAGDGRKATDKVRARVLPAPEVPAALAGTWKRTIRKPVPPDPGASGSLPNPAGSYTITFARPWIRDRYPGTFKPITSPRQLCKGCILDDDYVPSPTTFKVWGAVTTSPMVDPSPNPIGGWWCNPDGPSATYTWSVHADTLTLAPVGGKDRCGQRGRTWTGTWTRVNRTN
jgi:hypothetical protein